MSLAEPTTEHATPRDFGAYRGLHAGATMLVCGCGESLNLIDTLSPGLITIGVNDVGRKFTPDYLVVVNPRTEFNQERLAFIENTCARAVFSQLGDLRLQHSSYVRFRLGAYNGVEPSAGDTLHYTQNSPYVALSLAMHLGAKRIGLIGVDFTDDHFFARTGRHPLAAKLEQINAEYARLAQAAGARGIEIVNVSPMSKLTAFPKLSLNEVCAYIPSASHRTSAPAAVQAVSPLNIVSYATTPIAGVPEILARCISARTTHQATCVWASGDYGNGVRFDGGLSWRADEAAALRALDAADLVIIHNGKVAPQHRALIARKPVLTMAHNYAWNVDQTYVRKGFPGVVVGQYQATLPEFAGWRIVPNPIPLWETAFTPDVKAGPVRLCYTPSGPHDRYPPGHRLYWHSKGYESTIRVLDMLAWKHGVILETVRGRNVSHAESLAMKRRAHIVIDECVTGSYHRNSLEGLAAGCVVVNGVGLLPAVAAVLASCTTPATGDGPFVKASLDDLADVLEGLVALGPEQLARRGLAARAWLENHWDFAAQWTALWLPAIDQALRTHLAPSSRSAEVGAPRNAALTQAVLDTNAPARAETPACEDLVTVVVPQGGLERLPLLAATIGALKQNAAVGQIIISELGSRPWAHHIAERWGVDYVFTEAAGPFNKSRAINLGTALAHNEIVAWWDNDVLLPGPTLATAVDEMRRRRCDVFLPFLRMVYLNAHDSAEVRRGTRNPADCRPLASFPALQRAVGGIVLTRAAFVRDHGAMCEEFAGWGGEDNAWLHKARILGSVGATMRPQSVAYHLWHAGSGGIAKDPHRQNPNYAANVRLLDELRRHTTREQVQRRLPPPASLAPPWPGERQIVFLVPENAPPAMRALAQTWREQLSRLLGVTPVIAERCPPATSAAIAVCFGLVAAAAVDHTAIWSVIVTAATDIVEPALQRSDTIVLTSNAAVRAQFAVAGWPVWQVPYDTAPDAEASIASLIGAVSLISHRAEERARQAPKVVAETSIPVWQYWEGPCPDWIAACHDSVIRHAPQRRLLGPREFDALWQTDRDIDIARLHVAHRADFIRAYLLAHHGGLWLDSDCILMRSLHPLLDALPSVDFIAHREREGYVSNAFMGARPGSAIAARFYAHVRDVLRSGRQLGWISIGNEPLTGIINGASERWLELDTELVQPLCWSRPEAFFAPAPPEAAALDDRGAYCHMLSNQSVGAFQKAHPKQGLLASGSLFSRILDLARERPSRDAAANAFLDRLIETLEPRTVIDVGAGNATLAPTRRKTVDNHVVSVHDAMTQLPRTRWDLAILGEQVWTEAPRMGIELRAMAMAHARFTIAMVKLPQLGGARIRPAADLSDTDRTLAAVLGEEVVDRKIFWTDNGERCAVALLSASGARVESETQAAASIFSEMHARHAEQGLPTTSGPGSTLEQTAGLRERVPGMLQHLGVESVLDVGCGDYFWQRHMFLGVRRYVGIDVIASLVERLQREFGSESVAFQSLDARQSPLPACDLILSRDCLVHLSDADLARVLRQVDHSGARYLLTTTFPAHNLNADIESGDWRPLNLCAPPFSFPPPVFSINEKCSEQNGTFADKALGLWRISDLQLERLHDRLRPSAKVDGQIG